MEFLNSIFKSVNERLTSPLYGALIVASIMWNYDIFLTIFFVDNEAILKVTKDQFMKSTYIHDVLFPTVFGRNLLECMHPLLAYMSSFTWRFLPVFGLTWIFLTQIPKIANEVHGIEREFMKTREQKNINYEEDIAKYRLENSNKQDELLQKQKKDVEIRAEVLKLQESNNQKSILLSQEAKLLPIKNNSTSIPTLDGMTDIEKVNYRKIINSEKARNNIIEIIKYIDPLNDNEDTVNYELGIDDNKITQQFNSIKDWKIIGNTLRMDLETNKYKYYYYLKDFGRKVLLQMLKDGYLKEEDLIGKI